jgi:DNA modification methylase
MHLNESNGYWYVRRDTGDGKETVAKLGKHDDRPAIHRPQLIQDKAENVCRWLPDNSVDCIVTDPPFGVNMEIGQRGVGVASELGSSDESHADVHNHSTTEFMQPFVDLFDSVLSENAHCYIFGNYKSYPALYDYFTDRFNLSRVLVWDKMWNGSGPPNCWLPQCEWIAHFKKGSPKIHGTQQGEVLEFERVRYVENEKIHQTQKPRGLLEKLIRKSTQAGDVVFDPFGGSYSTVRAAMRTFRRGVSCELDPEIHRTGESLVSKELNEDPEYGCDWTNITGLRVENVSVAQEPALSTS